MGSAIQPTGTAGSSRLSLSLFSHRGILTFLTDFTAHTANWSSTLRGCHVNCSQYRRWWSVCSSEMPRLIAASVLRKNILEKTCSALGGARSV